MHLNISVGEIAAGLGALFVYVGAQRDEVLASERRLLRVELEDDAVVWRLVDEDGFPRRAPLEVGSVVLLDARLFGSSQFLDILGRESVPQIGRVDEGCCARVGCTRAADVELESRPDPRKPVRRPRPLSVGSKWTVPSRWVVSLTE